VAESAFFCGGKVDKSAPSRRSGLCLAGLRRPAFAMVYVGYGLKEWLGGGR